MRVLEGIGGSEGHCRCGGDGDCCGDGFGDFPGDSDGFDDDDELIGKLFVFFPAQDTFGMHSLSQ